MNFFRSLIGTSNNDINSPQVNNSESKSKYILKSSSSSPIPSDPSSAKSSCYSSTTTSVSCFSSEDYNYDNNLTPILTSFSMFAGYPSTSSTSSLSSTPTPSTPPYNNLSSKSSNLITSKTFKEFESLLNNNNNKSTTSRLQERPVQLLPKVLKDQVQEEVLYNIDITRSNSSSSSRPSSPIYFSSNSYIHSPPTVSYPSPSIPIATSTQYFSCDTSCNSSYSNNNSNPSNNDDCLIFFQHKNRQMKKRLSKTITKFSPSSSPSSHYSSFFSSTSPPSVSSSPSNHNSIHQSLSFIPTQTSQINTNQSTSLSKYEDSFLIGSSFLSDHEFENYQLETSDIVDCKSKEVELYDLEDSVFELEEESNP